MWDMNKAVILTNNVLKLHEVIKYSIFINDCDKNLDIYPQNLLLGHKHAHICTCSFIFMHLADMLGYKQSCRGYGPSSRVHRWWHGAVLRFELAHFQSQNPNHWAPARKTQLQTLPSGPNCHLCHAEVFRTQPFPLLRARFEFPQIPAGCTNVSTVPKKWRWEHQCYCCCTDSPDYMTSSRKPGCSESLKRYTSPFSFSTLNK